MEGKQKNAIYCSIRCKNQGYIMKTADNLRGISVPIELPSNGLPNDAQFMINFQKNQIDKLERELAASMSSKKNWKGKFLEIKEKYKDYKQDCKLRDLQRDYEKPDGLSGLMDTHGDLIKEVAPQLLGMIKNFMSSKSGAAQQMGSIPEATNSKAEEIMKWLAQIDEDLSNAVMRLLTDINTKTNNDKAASIKLITQIVTFINNGTFMSSQG